MGLEGIETGLRLRVKPYLLAGGRITGKVQGMTLGLLNVQTEALRPEENPVGESVPASNFGVVRLKRDILERSTVGAFLVNTERGGVKRLQPSLRRR